MKQTGSQSGAIIIGYQYYGGNPEDVGRNSYGESDDKEERPPVIGARKQVGINYRQGQ